MNDWSLWLGSNETRAAINLINKYISELKETVTNGSHIQEKDTNKIALDFTYSLGQIDGLRMAIELVNDIEQEIEGDN